MNLTKAIELGKAYYNELNRLYLASSDDVDPATGQMKPGSDGSKVESALDLARNSLGFIDGSAE
jgi:hypothetical protein